jgi:hypothetical protein
MNSHESSKESSDQTSQEDEKDLNQSEQKYSNGSSEKQESNEKASSEEFSEEEKESNSGKPFGWFRVEGNKAFIEKAKGYMPEELELKSYK